MTHLNCFRTSTDLELKTFPFNRNARFVEKPKLNFSLNLEYFWSPAASLYFVCICMDLRIVQLTLHTLHFRFSTKSQQ